MESAGGIENLSLLSSVSVGAKNQFRSDLLSQRPERLDKTGILKLEDALLKFMESTDGALVIAESAVDQVLIPALDAFTKHVAEAQAVLNKTETQLECRLSKGENCSERSQKDGKKVSSYRSGIREKQVEGKSLTTLNSLWNPSYPTSSLKICGKQI